MTALRRSIWRLKTMATPFMEKLYLTTTGLCSLRAKVLMTVDDADDVGERGAHR